MTSSPASGSNGSTPARGAADGHAADVRAPSPPGADNPDAARALAAHKADVRPPSPSHLPPLEVSQAFDLLHPRVRRWIWDQGWAELRDAQEEAIPLILGGREDVIIAAATASGKTEAAFLPIASVVAEDAGGSVRVLYVSPLKALINDQFERLERLCEHLAIPVHRWHGDVGAGAKERLLRRPAGVLLITPESLEALFVLQGPAVRRLFDRLAYVVVDELRSLIGAERGRQLQSLLHRVETAVGERVPRIGLSATLGDMRLAAGFLRPGEADDVRLVVSAEGGQELRLQVRGYRVAPPLTEGEDDTDAEADGDGVAAVAEHLFATLRGGHNLIFANSRREVEIYADRLRRMCEGRRLPNEFWPHHGSLSRALREEAEALLKDPSRPVTVACTTTLEMGIDIGTMASIAQIGAPPSVAAMRQRLGRSGRRGEPAVMRIYVQEEEITPQTALLDTLRAELVQSIAMVRLLVRGWYEPPPAGALHLSTLVQQTLSLIAQHGGVQPLRAWRLLCERGPFAAVDQRSYAALLRSLAAHDLIVQSPDGALLLGGRGERLVNHYSFYAAFVTAEEYRLVSGGRTLGTLPVEYPLEVGMFIIFAGRRWRVTAVDVERRVIEVVAAAGGRAPRFSGSGPPVHEAVRREMFAVYTATDVPAFLDARARDLLDEGRAHFARHGLRERPLVAAGGDTLLFPWTGDRIQNTLALQLRARGLIVSNDGPALTIGRGAPEVVAGLLVELARSGPPNGELLAATVANKATEKYDRFLDEDLLRADYASRELDPAGAHRVLTDIVKRLRPEKT